MNQHGAVVPSSRPMCRAQPACDTGQPGERMSGTLVVRERQFTPSRPTPKSEVGKQARLVKTVKVQEIGPPRSSWIRPSVPEYSNVFKALAGKNLI